MKFYHKGKPIAKQRHRTTRTGITYDPQYDKKLEMKFDFAAQNRQQGYLKPIQGAISAILDIKYPISKSWSKKRKLSVLTGIDSFANKKPDIDNVVKWYFDILNQIAYDDDSQIVSVFAKKTYSENPGVEINLTQLGDKMINEHAITYKDKLTIEDLNYIIKKANTLGLSNRHLIRVSQEEDDEGTHLYFNVEGLKEKDNAG